MTRGPSGRRAKSPRRGSPDGLEPILNSISKPFSPRALLAKIREYLPS